MKWKIYIVILLVFIPLQTTVMDYLSLGGIKADLGLIIVCLVGIRMGETQGIIVGILVGALMDLFSGGTIGANLFTKPMVGWISGIVGRTIVNIQLLASAGLLLGLSVLAGGLIYLFSQIFKGDMDLLMAFRWIILPQALYNTAVGMLFMSLIPAKRRI